jgi:hypothetical protein
MDVILVGVIVGAVFLTTATGTGVVLRALHLNRKKNAS